MREFHISIAFTVAGASRTTNFKVGDFSELGEVFFNFFFVKSVREVADVNETSGLFDFLLLFSSALSDGNSSRLKYTQSMNCDETYTDSTIYSRCNEV